jgi:hypothetical protein
MTHRAIDLEKLRGALRRMDRGTLLMIAERAAEVVPKAKLRKLLGDIVRLDELAETESSAMPLLDEARKFHEASLRGKYYESFDVNSKNYMQESKGTEAFIAEFDRLLGKCIQATKKGPRSTVREAFELLMDLLRHIDDADDDVLFFADEGGSWAIGVDWRSALPSYFRCLADVASAEEYACKVNQAIEDFADHERPRHLAEARRVANAEQKAALRHSPAKAGRR